ncbi:MAG TPA: BamA/TamA family outer membrane protein [Bacteroidota bacterium]|nr:BamA/TamA family outer membrane protein [Bacteroidota bacterium]
MISGIVLFASGTRVYAQQAIQGYEVAQLKFEGNKQLSTDQLVSVIRTRQTPMGIWKWIYHRMGEKEYLGGQKPEYFDPIIFDSDLRQLRQYYQDHGFFHAAIDTNILMQPEDRSVAITIKIFEGPRSYIDTIIYKGIDALPPDVSGLLMANKQISVGAPFVVEQVEAELRRFITVFANNGYINVKADTVTAVRYASTNNYKISFSFTPGIRYQFGTITVQQDSSTKNHIDSSVVLQHLDYASNDFYSEQKKIESERNLNRLGVFEASKIENLPLTPTDKYIPTRIKVRTRPFQEFTPELGINDENNAFNISTGAAYDHRNIFGGAQNFSTQLRLTMQSPNGSGFNTILRGNTLRDSSLVAKMELTSQITWPYFLNNKTSITATFSGSIDKQKAYYLPLLITRLGTMSQTATYTKMFIDWTMQLSHPTTVATQTDTQFTVGYEFEKQFNSILTFTLQRDKRNDLFYPSEGFFHSLSVEEGGLLPHSFGKTIGIDLPYAQYFKSVVTGQWYWDEFGQQILIWATRLHVGGALLYDHSPLDVPFTQRFYAGGSGSVRGWQARVLGAVPDPELGGDALIEGTTEARWNPLRNAGSLWFFEVNKLSFVFFYDLGNVWSEPKQIRVTEVAMATGFGLRYNTVAGPIRIDFGMKVYDPESQIWITQRRFFPETFSGGIIHLGVGHTF